MTKFLPVVATELDLKRVPHVLVLMMDKSPGQLWNADTTHPIYMRGYDKRMMLDANEVIIPRTSCLHAVVCQRCRMNLGCAAAGRLE